MSIAARLRRAPLRITTGGFILNSGLVKLTSTDEDEAKAVHSMAVGAYPQLERIKPRTFQKLVGAGECTLGAVLLLPVFSPRVAGAGLMAFSGSLLGVYWRTPGMHVEGSVRPTQAGIALAKDSWMFGAGAALFLDGMTDSAKNLRDDSTPKLEEAKAAIAAGAASAAAAVGAAAGQFGDKLKEAEEAAAAKAPEVKEALVRATEVVTEKAQAAGAVVAEKTSEAGSALAEVASSTAAKVQEQAPSKDELADLAKQTSQGAKEAAKSAKDSAKQTAKEAAAAAADTAASAKNSAKDNSKKAFASLKG